MFLAEFDFYPKFSDDVRQRTKSGGILAIISFVTLILLLSLRLNSWMHAPPVQRFVVDTPDLPFINGRRIDAGHLPKMEVNFDVLLHHVPCPYVSLDVVDVLKERDSTVQGRVRMQRFDASGAPINAKAHPKNESAPPPGYCGSCYSMRSGCCNTCKEVRRAFKAMRKTLPPIASIEQCTREGFLEELKAMANESCRVHGSVSVHQHPGALHIAPGDTYDAADSAAFAKLGVSVGQFNMSHKINHFSLGVPRDGFLPLDGRTEIQSKPGIMKMHYFVRAVPVGLGRQQFSISASSYQNYRGGNSTKFPGIFFNYDISPISVIEEQERSVFEFLVEVSGIFGGVFSIASFIDLMAFKFAGIDPVLTKTE